MSALLSTSTAVLAGNQPSGRTRVSGYVSDTSGQGLEPVPAVSWESAGQESAEHSVRSP